MDSRTLEYIAAATAGHLQDGDGRLTVSRICSDSRKVQPGDLFWALPGERFDGHDYLGDAARRGAVAAVVGQHRAADAAAIRAVVAVEDPRRALGQLAARYRQDFSLPVVAVGGSNGKTTTKDLLATVLSVRYRTLRSEASFNNDIGVPLTLLQLTAAHETAVLEVGTNHPGELGPLVAMVAPRYGVITSVGREHLEHFGSLAGVAAEEGRLAELLPATGKLFLNGDTACVALVCGRTSAEVVRVGLDPYNDWQATARRSSAVGTEFDVRAAVASWSGAYSVPLPGRHQIRNALLTLAVACELGLTPDEARTGLARCVSPPHRMQWHTANGLSILDDCYNANADSMTAALETLSDLGQGHRRIAVLGDMAELGEHTEAAHVEVGTHAAAVRVDALFAVGRMAGVTAGAARTAGAPTVFEFSDVQEAAAALRSFVRAGDVVLVKGSRTARLESVVENLCKAGEPMPAGLPKP